MTRNDLSSESGALGDISSAKQRREIVELRKFSAKDYGFGSDPEEAEIARDLRGFAPMSEDGSKSVRKQ